MAFLFFIIILSVLVVIHELGHYVAARMFGIKAEEFGFGFPPRIVGVVHDGRSWKLIGPKDQKTYQKTIWSLNWLPFGGFVRIKGEQENGMSDADSLHSKPIWQRIVVMAAGVCMNWLLAAVIFSGLFFVGTQASLEDLPAGARVTNQMILVTDIVPGSPADMAGIQPGDEIVTVNDVQPKNASVLRQQIQESGTRELGIAFKHDGEVKTFGIHPIYLPQVGRTAIGVGLADVGTVSLGFADAVANGVIMTSNVTKGIIFAFGDLLHTLFAQRKIAQDVSGPIGIAVVAGKVAKQGVEPLLQFAALLSVNLAVVNFLPIPALDGGRALFLVVEKLRNRPMSRKLEMAIHNIAFILLLFLILFITARDLVKYGGVIFGGIRGVLGM